MSIRVSDFHLSFISQKSACKKKTVGRWTKTWEIIQNCNLSVCFAAFHLLLELLQLLFCLKRLCQQRWKKLCLFAARGREASDPSAFLLEMPLEEGEWMLQHFVAIKESIDSALCGWYSHIKFQHKSLDLPSQNQDRASAIFSSSSSTVGASQPVSTETVGYHCWEWITQTAWQESERSWKKISKRKWAYPISPFSFRKHTYQLFLGRPWRSTTSAIDKNFCNFRSWMPYLLRTKATQLHLRHHGNHSTKTVSDDTSQTHWSLTSFQVKYVISHGDHTEDRCQRCRGCTSVLLLQFNDMLQFFGSSNSWKSGVCRFLQLRCAKKPGGSSKSLPVVKGFKVPPAP